MSMTFRLFIKTKMLKNKYNIKLSDGVLILLINVEMPTLIGILTFIIMINFMLIEFSMKKLII